MRATEALAASTVTQCPSTDWHKLASHKGLPRGLGGRHIIVGTSKLGAVRAIVRPKQQSGQQYIEAIYRAVKTLRLNGNAVVTAWAPSQAYNELKSQAKHAARRALQQEQRLLVDVPSAKTTVLRNALAKEKATPIPPHVGRFSKDLDQALPGADTKKLYDKLRRKEAAVPPTTTEGTTEVISAISSNPVSTGNACISR